MCYSIIWKKTFGIHDVMLAWINSYLSCRTQKVAIGDLGTDLRATSDPVIMTFRMPQGSVLGPILFTLYTMLLGQICKKHKITYQMYADDSQVYLTFKPRIKSSQEDCINRLESCIQEIRNWMCVNLLKLNGDKMEFIIFGSSQQLKKINNIEIRVDEAESFAVEFIRNLGYFMDFLMKKLITSTNLHPPSTTY